VLLLQEAEDFAVHLTHYRALLLRYDKALDAFLSQLPLTSRANLPRVWEAVEGTNMCEPTSPEIAAEVEGRRSHR
jgi:hypothetical protein